ncbi:putative solute carrier family 22 member 31 [Latimeria chalumnae]|nr:PREDICTED: putative solute carrier family 22 member 31 [Latimeria chalumnae]|eukprot:XP_006001096.1 PREDICTED: putative solute carrier family 22 member 31 [Latimeria chalumnae]
MATMAVSFNLLSEDFYTGQPSHHCRPDPQLLPGNLSGAQLLNVSLPWNPELGGWSRCLLYSYTGQQSRESESGFALPNRTVPCTRGWQYSAVAGLESNLVSEWNLVCNDSWRVPLEKVSYMIGWIGGFIVFGSASDRFGRRTLFVLCLFFAILLGVGVALSQSPIMFLLMRMFQGMTLAGVFLSVYIIRLELCDPAHRLMIVMLAGLFSVAGGLLLPGLAAMSRGWRILQGVVTLPLLLLLTYWCFPSGFPESPRWLLATRQVKKCRKVLQLFAERNGENPEDEIYSRDGLFTEIDSLCEGRPLPRYYTVWDIVTTRAVWRNSLILGFTAFIGGGIQYCFAQNLFGFWTSFYPPYFLQTILGGLSCIFLCLTVNRCGRRGILLLTTIVTGISSLLLLALTQYLHDGLVLVLSILGILASHAVSMLSMFFAAEVLPTVVRGAGLGLIMAAGVLGRAAGPIMDIHNKRGFFLHHVVFASFAVLSVLSIMLLPESKRKPLPDSLKDGEVQRRPPLFLSRHKDELPLLHNAKMREDYNPENYSRLVTATKKMLSRENTPLKGAQCLEEESHGEENEEA